jgi:multidrug efflux pump subunit AcrB
MMASTLTTVVVFVPLIMLTGVTGFFFRSLAFTLAAALIVSLALALFVTPVIAGWLVRPEEHPPERTFVSRILSTYEPSLRAALRNRRFVYAGCAAVLLLTGVLLSQLPSDFLPSLDEGQLQIDYRMPVGTTLDASDAASLAMERVVLSDPAVASDVRVTGEDPNGFSPIQVREGKMRIRLKPENQRAPYEVVADRLRDRVSKTIPAAQLDFTQLLEEVLGDISGSSAPIEITIRGNDQATLVRLANALAGKLSKVRGLADVFSGVNYDDPTLRVDPNGRRLASLGVSRSDFGAMVQSQMQGSVAATLPDTASSLLVPVRVESHQGGDVIATPSGLQALTSIAATYRNRLSSDVTEINGQRVMIVTATLNGVDLSTAIARIREVLAETHLPPGYAASIGGAYRAQQQSFVEFLQVIGVAVVLVFFVMLATFKSYRLPLVILAAIPLALIGVALGLFLTGTPFNVSSFMGLLLLVGIVVKNGILLIDVANRRRMAGATVEDALVEAGRLRLRPIVMTTAAAIGGLLPLAFGLGSGAAMERPLAIAVIGGLSTSTAFTLIVIPVLYAGIAPYRCSSSVA